MDQADLPANGSHPGVLRELELYDADRVPGQFPHTGEAIGVPVPLARRQFDN